MIETPHAPLFAFARCTENQIRGVELTTASLERHLTDSEGGETARIRREMQDSEGSLQRRIEEVTRIGGKEHRELFCLGIDCCLVE